MTGPSRLVQDEREALVGDRAAIIRIVSALRRYRAEVIALLNKRYRDGEVDGAVLSSFESHIDDIESE